MPRHKSSPTLPVAIDTPRRGPGRPPKSNSSINPDQQAEQPALSGLYLFGKVIDRTRRTIQTRNDGSAEIVTYSLQDLSGRRYFVDEYTPDEYYEIGEDIEVPVYVKTFKKNNGDIGYSFCVQRQFGPARGEHF